MTVRCSASAALMMRYDRLSRGVQPSPAPLKESRPVPSAPWAGQDIIGLGFKSNGYLLTIVRCVKWSGRGGAGTCMSARTCIATGPPTWPDRPGPVGGQGAPGRPGRAGAGTGRCRTGPGVPADAGQARQCREAPTHPYRDLQHGVLLQAACPAGLECVPRAPTPDQPRLLPPPLSPPPPLLSPAGSRTSAPRHATGPYVSSSPCTFRSPQE